MTSSTSAVASSIGVSDVGGWLRTAFSDAAQGPLPDQFQALLDRMTLEADPERARPAEALSDKDFKAEISAVIPHLRAFGRSLSGSRDLADDLVQETLMKAWAARDRFQAGTNMRAWTFIILRNLFLSQMRRARFKGEWDDFIADKLLAAPAGQDRQMELGDLQRGLLELPQAQREALILVGAGGFAYEEAAAICKCAVGTIKSRVARGRAALETILNEGLLPTRLKSVPGQQSPLVEIMNQVDALTRA